MDELTSQQFTALKLKWLQIVVCTPGMSATSYRLAAMIALVWLSKTKGHAWPKLDTIAAALSTTRNAIIRATEQLEAHGLLTVTRSGWRGKSNEYRIAFPASHCDAGVTMEGAAQCDASDTMQCDASDTSIVTPAALHNVTPASPHPLEYIPDSYPIEDNPSYEAAPADLGERFQALWSHWPKPKGRADAEKALAEVLRQGAIWEDIARGAAAYVADRQRDDRGPAAVIHYTTPLGKWLREGEWEAWINLPDAEADAEAEQEALWLADEERRAAIRKAMPF